MAASVNETASVDASAVPAHPALADSKLFAAVDVLGVGVYQRDDQCDDGASVMACWCRHFAGGTTAARIGRYSFVGWFERPKRRLLPVC